jgi:hypothetical protein
VEAVPGDTNSKPSKANSFAASAVIYVFSVKVPPNCQVVTTPPDGVVLVKDVKPFSACKYLIVPLLSTNFTTPPALPKVVAVCTVRSPVVVCALTVPIVKRPTATSAILNLFKTIFFL